MKQSQFLRIATAEEADEVFRAAIRPKPLGETIMPLESAHNRILSRDIFAKINVPYFDRSNFDGFAVRAEDTFGAIEKSPAFLQLNDEAIPCGYPPKITVKSGTTTPISTGGVLPRGANAVVMVEDTQSDESGIQVLRPVVPGEGVSFAGSDIGAGEVVLRKGERVTFREIGLLAALGIDAVHVYRRPKVAVISTGDELILPGQQIMLGNTYDSNSYILHAKLEEIGCRVVRYGPILDSRSQLEKTLREALQCDFILLSGGTSKGEGDLNYKVVQQIGHPGILVHGVALKPGKPLCLASIEGVPTAILPGFPTSAIFTFTRFVEPILRIMGGIPEESNEVVEAHLPIKINSTKGKTEFLMVNLVQSEEGLSAYPLGKSSGSVSNFSKADGFIEIPTRVEIVDAGTIAKVTLLDKRTRPADLMIIGSHCIGLDYLISLLQKEGILCKFISVGSSGGLIAVRKGECDIAGVHLMEEKSGRYNEHLVDDSMLLVKGYQRVQGILRRREDSRFNTLSKDLEGTIQRLADKPKIRMVNRNRGSGTRILLDKLLDGKKPLGYLTEAKSHNAVAAAIAQRRADWGMAIQNSAQEMHLAFTPYKDEEFDFILPKKRLEKSAVQKFLEILKRPTTIEALGELGFRFS